MVKLLGRALRKQQKQDTDTHETVAPVEEQPRDRILVLVPGEGGFSFRLLAFPSIEHAAAYCLEHFPQRLHQLFSFRPHHQRPRDVPPGAPGQIEAIVMVRDEDRHGTVHLYSFVDMDTALAFIRAEGMRGLNLWLVLVYWSEPVALYPDAALQANSAGPELTGPPPPVLTQWQQPTNPVFDSLKGEPAAPPAFADEVHNSHARGFDPPFPPNTAVTPPPSSNFVPATDAPTPAPASQSFTPAPPPPAMQAEPPQVTPNGASFTTQKKEPRRWNAAEDFPVSAPVAAPAQARPASQGKGGAGGFIHRMRSWPGWDGFGPVIVGAAMLRWQTYDEARKDPYAEGRAKVLVGASIGASALSAALSGPLAGASLMPDIFAFIFFALFGAIGAAVFAACILLVGTQFVGARPERDDTRLFLHRLGLAAAPGPLLILGIIPIYGPMFTLGVLIWVMLTSIKATEIGLEMERQYAAFTAIISWLALFAIAVVIPALAS